jgi:diguanylate cyclase (GGDEF)-like protein
MRKRFRDKYLQYRADKLNRGSIFERVMANKVWQAYRVLFSRGGVIWRACSYLFLMWLMLHVPSDLTAGHNGTHVLRVERNIQFNSLSVSDGLAQVAVNAIVQDHLGYIWFGTQEGLSRYNGYRFENYSHDSDDPNSLSNEWIWSVLEDRNGRLWVGTDGGGLNRYDQATGTFIQYTHHHANPRSLSNDRVRVVVQASDGVLWIGTDGGGLNRYDPTKPAEGFTRYQFDSNVSNNSLPNDKVLAITEDHMGSLWIGTDGGGLARFDPVSEIFEVYRHAPESAESISSDRVRSLYADSQGSIWIGTEGGGLNLLDPARGIFRRFLHDANDPRSLSNNNVHSIVEDLEGTLWVGTSGGLNQWVPEAEIFLRYQNQPDDPASLIGDHVKSLWQDRGGVLWVGTNNGISRWNYISDAFVYYSKTKDSSSYLLNPLVTSIDQTQDGHIWVGTYGGGLARIDTLRGVSTHYRHDPHNTDSLSSDEIMSVFVDHNNQIWAGTRKDGLNRLNPVTGKVRRFRYDAADPASLAGDAIARIYGDPDGTLWVGTYGGGLNRLRPGSDRFDRFQHKPNDHSSLSSNRVLAIYRDSDGTLWVGTENGGLNEMNENNGSFIHYRHDPTNRYTLCSETAWDIMEGSDGSLWIATNGGGLNRWLPADRRLRRNRFQQYDKQEGLVSNTIQAILMEDNGALWLSSNRGLTRLDPETGHTRHFDSLNALKTNDFINGAKQHGHDGSLMFGSPDGLVMFHPDKIRSNSNPPPIVITAFSGNQRLVTSSSRNTLAPSITLKHTDYSVTFEFAALDFTSPDKNLYRYRLHGFDRDWIDPVRYHRATYTNLPSDKFRFEVQAANNDGVWNKAGAVIEIQVLPPLWRSTWAYVLYFLSGLAIFGIYIYIQRRKTQWEAAQRKRLEAQVQERTMQLSDRNLELEEANSKLKVASLTDSLTGLKNRRFFYEHIKREIAWIDRRAAELVHAKGHTSRRATDSIMDECSLFFMMIDLDGFKKINDTHGHHAGDEALLQVRDILVGCCRSADTVIRWGGDEFLIIGHSSGPIATENLAERLRSELARHTYELGNGALGKLSGSIGFAHYPFVPVAPNILHWENVVGIADQAAYLAKQNQRDAWVGIYSRATVATANNLIEIRDSLHALTQRGLVAIATSISKELSLVRSEPRSATR